MREIDEHIRKDVFDLWLKGYSYREIATKFRISISTISSIIEERRKQAPDLDELRRLNQWLIKNNSDIYEALRGAELQQKLDELNINPNQLTQYIELSKRLAVQEEADQIAYTKAALHLADLEITENKPYNALIDEYKNTKTKNQNLSQQNQELKKEIKTQKQETTKLDQKANKIRTEITRLIVTQKRLQEIGIEKTAKLAQYIQFYEKLGMDTKEVKQLAILKTKLAEKRIKPEELDNYIPKEHSLNQEISNLNLTKKEKQDQIHELEKQRKRLLSQNPRLCTADNYLRTNTVLVPCKYCPSFITLHTGTLEEYYRMLERGLVTGETCSNCGTINQYTANEHFKLIARTIIPYTKDDII